MVRLLIAALAMLPLCGEAPAVSVYQVGNSFTWDSQPNGIPLMAASMGVTWTNGYHIKCGSSLPNIVANPSVTCITPNSFGDFSTALPGSEWDHAVFQSFGGATLDSDAAAFQSLVQMTRSNPDNSDTRFYLYQSWPFKNGSMLWSNWESPLVGANPASTHTRAYFDALHSRITESGVAVTMIPQAEALFRVRAEVEAGAIPGYTSIDDFYRDDLHLTGVGGFIVATTILATILGEDPTGTPIPTPPYYSAIPDSVRDQLQSIVWDVVRHHPDAGLIDRLTPGDYDDSGDVEVADFELWRESFGSTTHLAADGNHDGVVNAADYVVWRNGVPRPALGTAAPEPSGAALVGLVALAATAASTGRRRGPTADRGWRTGSALRQHP